MVSRPSPSHSDSSSGSYASDSRSSSVSGMLLVAAPEASAERSGLPGSEGNKNTKNLRERTWTFCQHVEENLLPFCFDIQNFRENERDSRARHLDLPVNLSSLGWKLMLTERRVRSACRDKVHHWVHTMFSDGLKVPGAHSLDLSCVPSEKFHRS